MLAAQTLSLPSSSAHESEGTSDAQAFSSGLDVRAFNPFRQATRIDEMEVVIVTS